MDTESRIKDIPITGMAHKRSTGIVGLNLLLDGGFPQGSVIMVYGTPLAGVDLAALQFWKVEGEEGTYFMNDGDAEPDMIDATELYPEMYLPQMIGHRIVIDSFSTLVIKYGIDNALKFLRLARKEVRKRNANLMFIVYSDVHSPVEMTRIMRAADLVMELKTDIGQNEIGRTLIVHKIRDAPAPQRLLPFIITERGIEASTTSRVV
ncbi:RAD55 family ATPase [Methanoregula sp. UBA64]|jgi:KaiC/GvpD/RAD55 family RecA-like ATPase|uniref:RAD55 family ATPase n=1 Tax=Methanoregula sp. UBA64 TaxID=1915554 RepID=UPI0025D9022B|nr:ATPase domain-containing protein [Methanoregula sp. UBA64]